MEAFRAKFARAVRGTANFEAGHRRLGVLPSYITPTPCTVSEIFGNILVMSRRTVLQREISQFRQNFSKRRKSGSLLTTLPEEIGGFMDQSVISADGVQNSPNKPRLSVSDV